MTRTSRSIEIFLHAGVLTILIAGIAAFNDDVRRHVVNVVAGDRTSELSLVAGPADRVMHTIYATAHSYAGSDGTLLAFGLGAVVLFTLMIRS